MVLKVSLNTGINRIRLEFKEVRGFANALKGDKVLIESDWNLKLITAAICSASLYRINRIRLEFKAE